MLWRGKPVEEMHSKDFETLIKRIATLESRIDQHDMTIIDMRNKVLRKIQKLQEPDIEPSEPSIPKSLNSFSPFGR